jgi:hypothetical protein
MNKIGNYIVGAVLTLLALFGINVGQQTLSGVSVGSEYNATTTRAMTGGVALAAPAFRTIVSDSRATLGSVVIASTTAATIRLWNATSTTDSASTSIASFPASVAAGTYTFDSIADRGLIVELGTGFAGDYIITSRAN